MRLTPTFVGSVDQFKANIISGWALDRQHPEESIEVDLYIDGRLSAKFKADLPRPDLKAISPASDKKGFQFDVGPMMQKYLLPRLELYFGGSNDRIPVSPIASRYVNRPIINLRQLYSIGYCHWAPSPPAEIVRYITGLAASAEKQRENYLISGMVNAADIYNILLDAGLDGARVGFRIVDLGCGSGRYAPFLKQYMPMCEYTGYDIWEAAIVWAQNNIIPPFQNIQFALLDQKGGYAGDDAYDLPIDDATVDLVMAMSLFTHLSRDASLKYFRETQRILSGEGIALLTFRILDDDSKGEAAAAAERARLPMIKTDQAWWYGTGGYLDIFFTEYSVRELAAAANLDVLAIRRGSWFRPGADVNPAAQQDIVILKRSLRH